MAMLFNPIFRSIAVAGAALGLCAPLAAEVTRSADNGFISRHEAVVTASPKDVWLALISPSGWWRSEHTWSGDAANLMLTPQAGGCFCETIPEIDEPGRFTLQGSVEHMRVIQSYPEQALRMQGALGPLQSEPVIGILTIAISEVDSGTRIVWEYNVGGTMRYGAPEIAKTVDAVLGAQLDALATLLGPAAPSDPAASESKVAPGTNVAEPVIEDAAETVADAVPAPTPGAKSAAEPAPKTPSVGDVFGDIQDNLPR